LESLRILDLINTTPEVKPEKIALIGGDGNTLTYGQLNETVQNMSRYLKEQGVGKGQRFAVVLPNCMEMLLAYLTITNVAVFIPLGDELSEEQYQYYCKLLKADSVLIPDQFDSPLLKTAKAFNLRFTIYPGRKSIIKLPTICVETKSGVYTRHCFPIMMMLLWYNLLRVPQLNQKSCLGLTAIYFTPPSKE
jgi:acyl-CoA synthetase (AMP-forming)/AMP-acid ligase II